MSPRSPAAPSTPPRHRRRVAARIDRNPLSRLRGRNVREVHRIMRRSLEDDCAVFATLSAR